jgi:hypothetical protein
VTRFGSDPLDLSEREKEEVRSHAFVSKVGLVLGVFFMYLKEFMTVVDMFWCGFRKVYIGALYVRCRDKGCSYLSGKFLT